MLVDLRRLDRLGWLLGPGETEETLLARRQEGQEETGQNNVKAHDLTERLYHFRFEEVAILRSNDSLFPWQGAVLWEYSKGGVSYPVVQLRTDYKGWILRHYPLPEVLAHELVHAARIGFKEPLFEEILAYRTSKSFFRRFFGPVFLFPFEALLFLFIGAGACIEIAVKGGGFFALLFLGVVLAFLARLCFLQFIFYRAGRHLEQAGVLESLPCLLRLRDKEIVNVAFSSPSTVKEKLLTGRDLRLREVISSYFDLGKGQF